VEGAVDTAATQQRGVGGVDDGVHVLEREVAEQAGQARHEAILLRERARRVGA